MSKIVLISRKDDSRSLAGRLHDYLCDRFGEKNIIYGIENLITPGSDYVDAIEHGIQSANAVILLVGSQWSSGNWLSDVQNYDVIAIKSAITFKVRLIPVFVNERVALSADELPTDFSSLSRRVGIYLGDDTFKSDIVKLIEELNPLVSQYLKANSPDLTTSSQPVSKRSDETDKPTHTAETFDWAPTLLWSAVGWGLAGFTVSIPHLLFAPYSFNPNLISLIASVIGGGIAGYTIASILKRSFSQLAKQQFMQIVVGWAVADFVSYGLRFILIDDGLPYVIMITAFGVIGGAVTASVIAQLCSSLGNKRMSIMLRWSGVTFLMSLTFLATGPMIYSLAALAVQASLINAIAGTLGCALTLKEIMPRKDLAQQ